MEVELVWESRCRLGEGVVWNQDDASVYFVDIHGRELLAHTPASGAQRRWSLPQRIGWAVPRASGGWIVGLQRGVAALTLGPAFQLDWLHVLHAEDSPLRLNDAKADAAGRLWFGSMDGVDDSRPDGVFYRWAPGGAPEVVDTGYCVTNGPTFSLDGRTLFHTDSARSRIHAFDLAADGALSNKRTWLRFGDGEGHPDGMCTDADGSLWIAHWGGARVTRRDAAGAVTRTIALPAPNVTNVAFGGPDLRDLYITTARAGMSAEALADSPQAGALYVARGVGQGRLPDRFAG